MAKMKFKNTFGAASSANGIDLQRSDLWKVSLIPPSQAGGGNEGGLEAADETFAGPGATGTRTATLVAAKISIGHLIALKPAASAPAGPVVDITNVNGTVTVPGGTPSQYIAGTNNATVVGMMTWTNSLGGSGTFSSWFTWNVTVPLYNGTNVITVRGTNSSGTASSDTVSVYRTSGDPAWVQAFDVARGTDYGQVQLSWSNGAVTVLACTNRTYPTSLTGPTGPTNWVVLTNNVNTPWTHATASNYPSVYYRIVSGGNTSSYDVGKFDVTIAPGSIAWMSFPFGVQSGCDVLSEWFGQQLEARQYSGFNFPSVQKQGTPGGSVQNSDYYVTGGVTNWYPTDATVAANAGYILFLPQNHPGVKLTGIGMVQTNNVTLQMPYNSIPWAGLAYDVNLDMRSSGVTNMFVPPRQYSSFDYDFIMAQEQLGGSPWYTEYFIDNWGGGSTNFFPSQAGADTFEPGKAYLVFFSSARTGTGTWTCIKPY